MDAGLRLSVRHWPEAADRPGISSPRLTPEPPAAPARRAPTRARNRDPGRWEKDRL